MEQLRIFLSHSSHDKQAADQFVQDLRRAGADVWYDEHNLGAGHLMDEIQRELGRRPIFIVLLSKAAFASKWVKREVGWAYGLADDDPTRQLLPVTIGPIERSDFSAESGWLYLKDFKRIEANYQPYPLTEAIERTCRILGLTLPGAAPLPSQPQPQEDADDLLTRARALIAQEKYAEAIPFLERMTQQSPTSFEGWANLGLVYNQTQRFGDALPATERALARDPNQAWVWYNKGVALRNLKRYDEALAAYERGFDPTDARDWTARGNVLGDLKRTEEALTAYEQALKLNSQLAEAWNGKGNILYSLKRYDEALTAYEQALRFNPKFARAWYNKGLALENLHRYEEALDAFEHGFHPNDFDNWQAKARVLHALGRTQEALAAEQQAQALNP